MTDIHGKEIELDSTLEDQDGRRYKVIKGDFENSVNGEGPDLIADGGFKKILLSEVTIQTNCFKVV